MKLTIIKNTKRALIFIALASINTACVVVGPDYERPTMDVPNAYKERTESNKDTGSSSSRENENSSENNQQKNQPWWEIYSDSTLNELLPQVEIHNYSLQAALAKVQQAHAVADIARAGQYPALVAGGVNDIGVLLSWEIDLWGRVKRNTEASIAAAQASEADLAAAKLSMQAQLAQNYFLLRVQDAEIQLLQDTTGAYRRSLEISRNQYAVGVVGRENISQAQSQFSTAEVQIYKAQITRAQLEHSIAVLIGKAPAEFSLAVAPLDLNVPFVPRMLPSELLERRPDIASAERRMASASAQIGAAKAEAYPSLTLSSGIRVVKGFVGGSRVVAPLYTAGAISAKHSKALATYNAVVANYKQAVLTGFLEVEDNLVALELLEKAANAQSEVVDATRQSVEIMRNQYKAGIVNYQSIIIVQASSLNNERVALGILSRRLVSSVALVKALGGGWNATELKPAKD